MVKRLKLEEAVRESRKVLEARRAELWSAEKAASLAVGAVEAGGGWTAKRNVQAAKKAVDAAAAAMAEATREHEEAEASLIDFMGHEEDSRKGDFATWTARAKVEVARRTGNVQRLQKELLAEVRALTALHVVAREKAPRKVVSRRSSHFVVVEALDPAIKNLYPDADPVGSFRVEFFHAVRGERAGRWRILPGQSLDPGTVEVIWGDTGLGPELESIADLNVGYLFKPNGFGGNLKNEKLDTQNVGRFLEEEDLKRAALAAERTTA